MTDVIELNPPSRSIEELAEEAARLAVAEHSAAIRTACREAARRASIRIRTNPVSQVAAETIEALDAGTALATVREQLGDLEFFRQEAEFPKVTSLVEDALMGAACEIAREEYEAREAQLCEQEGVPPWPGTRCE